jgi:hypothetical protein
MRALRCAEAEVFRCTGMARADDLTRTGSKTDRWHAAMRIKLEKMRF